MFGLPVVTVSMYQLVVFWLACEQVPDLLGLWDRLAIKARFYPLEELWPEAKAVAPKKLKRPSHLTPHFVTGKDSQRAEGH